MSHPIATLRHMDIEDTIVYGERVADLLPALQAFRASMARRDDGMYEGRVSLKPNEATPFLRAHLRVQAELMLEDADSMASPVYDDRTYEQRAADAFVRLVTSLPGQGRAPTA